MQPSTSPVLPLPFTVPDAKTGARHLHLILPYAAMVNAVSYTHLTLPTNREV